MMRSPARWKRGFAVTIAIASRQAIWRIPRYWTNRGARSTNCRRCSGCRASIRFSAVEAPERFAATGFFLREHGGRCERAIAGGMAVAIVDRLEAIQIEHDDRVTMMVALRVRVGLLELVRQPSAIVQAGQRIVRRLPMEL